MITKLLVQLLQRSMLRSLVLAAVAAAIAMSVLLTAGVSAQSTMTESGGPKPTIVLVHGAFADASSWDGSLSGCRTGDTRRSPWRTHCAALHQNIETRLPIEFTEDAVSELTRW